MITVILTTKQRTADHTPAIVLNPLREGVIHGKLDQNRISRLRIGFHRHGKSRHNARCLHKPFLLRFPVMPPFHPVSHNLKVRSFHITVAENALFHALRQRILYVGGSPEIHIRHPQRQYVLRHPPVRRKIIFQRPGISSLNYPVKIQISFRHLLFPLSFIIYKIPQCNCLFPKFQL